MTNEEIQVIEHHLRAGSKLLAAGAYSEFTGVDLDDAVLVVDKWVPSRCYTGGQANLADFLLAIRNDPERFMCDGLLKFNAMLVRLGDGEELGWMDMVRGVRDWFTDEDRDEFWQIVWEIVDANPGLEPMVNGLLDDEEEK